MPSFHCKGCRMTIYTASPVEQCPACGATVSALPGLRSTKIWRLKRRRRHVFHPRPKLSEGVADARAKGRP